MAVRFVIGRAGTGKTRHCLDAMRTHLRENPIDGPRLILLVPEQASLQMERAILSIDATPDPHRSSSEPPAAHRAEVLSFQRLAYRVIESVGGPMRQALTEPARTMVLRHLVAARAPQLRFYGRAAREGVSAARLGGLIGRLGDTIAELIQEGIDPDQLAAADNAPTPGGSLSDDDPARQAKLRDMAMIYRAYLDYLGDRRLDPSQHLEVARAWFERCAWLDGAWLWVDGFASLSGQETLTLIELAKRCRCVDITVMTDSALRDTDAPASPSTRAARRLFSRTHSTYLDLRDRCLRAGLGVEEPVILDVSPPRFRASPWLASIERRLFAGDDEPAPPNAAPPNAVELAELPSRRIEVEHAVSKVCQWVQDRTTPYRYRDIAVIVRDLEPYHDLLSEALEARQIPFFIDRRRPVTHHPLVELLRSAPTLAAENMPLESIRLILKTGLVLISAEEADEIENYVLAHAISGIEAWRAGDWVFRPQRTIQTDDDAPGPYETGVLERVNRARKVLLDALDLWLTLASTPQSHDGPTWTTAILRWLDRLNAGATLQRWADDAEVDGDIDQADEHRQVWRDVMSFLDDLAFAFRDTPLTVRELADVIDAGLSGLTLGLTPPTVDQVLVGSIERSRHPDIRAALILGFNDSVFPRPLVEHPILNDDDRARLRAVGIPIRPGARERSLDEAMLVYVALTRPSETLVVTYAAADNDGKPLRPSPYVEALRAACPGLTPRSIGAPRRTRSPWDVLSTRDLADRLVSEFRTRPAPPDDDRTVRARWNELYESTRTDLAADPAARYAMAALDSPTDAPLSPAGVRRWHGGSLRTSVSELETFAACPFQRFARHVLRLRERPTAALEPVDVGQVHHAILEDFYRAMAGRGTHTAPLGEGELLDHLHESCHRVGLRLPAGGLLSDARNAYQLSRSASELARVVRAQRRLARSGSSHPRGTEVPFGFEKHGGLPAMELSTPGGRHVWLRGYIDRVDLAELGDEMLGIVVDYKRTPEKRLDLGEVYHGLSLQLLGYLLVLREVGHSLTGRPIRPIGALYVSIVSQYHGVDHPDAVRARDDALHGTSRPRGLLTGDEFHALDQSTDPGWSEGYAVFRKQDGTFGHVDHSDTADAPAFQALLDHARVKLGSLADEILDGCVAVRPYRLGDFSPCSWCPMPAVCRFDMGISNVRFLETLRRSEVFHKLGAVRS